ncbi:unnamed protein product [Cochlearia groenlandica]
MTYEQLETLRKQIAIFSTICEQMHKTLIAQQQQQGLAGGLYAYDPLMSSIGHKMVSRGKRWTPTPMQLQILERIFDQEGNGTPKKQKVKDITQELSQHGPVVEQNVYNWFQNRRARYKKKQHGGGSTSKKNNNNNNGVTETEKRKRPESLLVGYNNINNAIETTTTTTTSTSCPEDLCFQIPELSSSDLDFLVGKMGLSETFHNFHDDHVQD